LNLIASCGITRGHFENPYAKNFYGSIRTRNPDHVWSKNVRCKTVVSDEWKNSGHEMIIAEFIPA
jgi:hypothetical protein